MHIFKAVSSYSRNEAMVAVDGNKILGLCALLRIAPKCVAIGCFNVSRGRNRDEVTDLLVGASIDRAKQTAHNFISCIPGRDMQPATSILEKFQFSKEPARAIFAGKSGPIQRNAAKEITGTTEILNVIGKLFPTLRTMNLCFRPIKLNQETLEVVLSSGCLLVSRDQKGTGAVLVHEARCLTKDEYPLYLVPDYLTTRISPEKMKKAGEINVLGLDESLSVLDDAIGWLAARGVEYVNVYAQQDRDTGVRIMARGFSPVGDQIAWSRDIIGPLDAFVLK